MSSRDGHQRKLASFDPRIPRDARALGELSAAYVENPAGPEPPLAPEAAGAAILIVECFGGLRAHTQLHPTTAGSGSGEKSCPGGSASREITTGLSPQDARLLARC